MKIIFLTGFLVNALYISCYCQQVQNDKFEYKLNQLLNFTIPVIDVTAAIKFKPEFVFLDAREKEEYDLSHIEGAGHIGFENFDISEISHLDKGQNIIVYCSVGYRSEKIGERLKKAGYKNIYNLYGSIFEWVNRGYPIVDSTGTNTLILHTYNKNWSQWVDNAQIVKVW